MGTRQRLERASARLGAMLGAGTELATSDDAAVIWRLRAFSLIAFMLMLAAIPLLVGIPDFGGVIAAFAMAMTAAATSIWAVGLEGGRHARLCTHITLGTILASLTLGAVEAGSASSMNIMLPSLLVLVACHLLGVRAGACWTAAGLASVAIAVFLPEASAADEGESLSLRFLSRGIFLLGLFAIAAAGRGVADRQAQDLEFLARHDSLTGLLSRWESPMRSLDPSARSR